MRPDEMDSLIGFGKPASKTADWIVDTYIPNAPVSNRLSIEHAIATAIIDSRTAHPVALPSDKLWGLVREAIEIIQSLDHGCDDYLNSRHFSVCQFAANADRALANDEPSLRELHKLEFVKSWLRYFSEKTRHIEHLHPIEGSNDGLEKNGCPKCCGEEALKIVEALLSQEPGEARGTSECPICGKDEPHGHDREQISIWVNGRLSAWGWKAYIYNHFTDKPYGWYYWPHHVGIITRFTLSRPDDISGYIPLFASPVTGGDVEAMAAEIQRWTYGNDGISDTEEETEEFSPSKDRAEIAAIIRRHMGKL